MPKKKFIKMSTTSRGFSIGNFTDLYDAKCSVQESSLATQAAIWLGVDDPNPKIMASDAIRMGLETNGETTGWVPFHIPEQVLISTRMHLTQEQVRELIPVLQKFVDTGDIK